MTSEATKPGFNISREQMIQLLNEDLAGEYQAIIVQEQEHEIDLSAALDINVPPPIAPSGKKPVETR
jgi:hypothetical protein